MQELHIKPTKSTPQIACYHNGSVFIAGRSLPEDPISYFQPLMEWIEMYGHENMKVNIKLEYFNTSTSKVLYEMLKNINKKFTANTVNIIWQYEEGDDDTYESGMLYSEELPNLAFSFKEYSELEEVV
ncbi:MAG TPA: DUF1987 domain-containing protein [Bacteroidales bacterium]|nr:DUF1987 domain-containing protein [Bacteroidales bacterium]